MTMKQCLWVSIAILFVFSVFNLSSIYLYSFKSSNRNADVALVLGAAVWDSAPSPVFKERINHSILLYQSGQVKKLLFTGGIGLDDKKSEAQVAKDYALINGVPAEDIILEAQSQRTQNNLLFAKPLLAANRLATVLVVSDPLHMKRAMVMALDLGINAFPSPTKTSRYRSYRAQGNMLLSETYYYMGYQIRRL